MCFGAPYNFDVYLDDMFRLFCVVRLRSEEAAPADEAVDQAADDPGLRRRRRQGAGVERRAEPGVARRTRQPQCALHGAAARESRPRQVPHRPGTYMYAGTNHADLN